MTSDDFNTWRVVYKQFVGAASKYGISFSLNNDPEAQDSSKVRIMTAEMSHENQGRILEGEGCPGVMNPPPPNMI